MENSKFAVVHSGQSFHVIYDRQPDNSAWDDFLLSLPDGHHEQTSLWGQVRVKQGWDITRLIVKENDKIVGGAQVMVRTIKRVIKCAYITYGPCTFSCDVSLEQVVVSELKKLLRVLKVTVAVVGLPFNSTTLANVMEKSGFARKPSALPPHFLEATLVLDLSPSLDQILSGMRTSTKLHVKQSWKRGIIVRQGNESDLVSFYDLMLTACKRRGTTPNPASPDFFKHLWSAFKPRTWVQLFVATHENQTVASAIAFHFGDWFRYWKIGWSGDKSELRPNEALLWEMIKHAKNVGCKHFDFVELDVNQAKAILNGEKATPTSNNATFFKLGFGGNVVLLPGTFCYSPNPILNTALRLGLLNIFKFPLLSKILNKTIST